MVKPDQIVPRQDRLDQLMTMELKQPFAVVHAYFGQLVVGRTVASENIPDVDQSVPLDGQTHAILQEVTRFSHEQDPRTLSRDELTRYRELTDFRNWLKGSDFANDILSGKHEDDPKIFKDAIEAYGTALKVDVKRVESMLPAMREHLTERLELLVGAGKVPAVLLERLRAHRYADMARLRIFDSSQGYGKHGAFDGWSHEVGLRAFMDDEKLFDAYVHEAMHALSGTTKVRQESHVFDPSQPYQTTRVGFGGAKFLEIESEGGDRKAVVIATNRALNEGVTELLKDLVVHGRTNPIDQLKGQAPRTRYAEERTIVSILARRVGINTILNAYAEDFDPDEPEGPMKNMRTLKARVAAIYGKDFLHTLDEIDREKGVGEALHFVIAEDKAIEIEMEAQSA